LIRFGVFEADLTTGELRRMGVRVAIQEQPFQVLAALLERPRSLVTREELRQRIWPKEVFVDFDHGLNKAVSKLRVALGDEDSTPRFIETLPRRGYRFVAAVSSCSASAGATIVARLLHEGTTIPLLAGVHVIGRDEGCAVCLNSSTVSRAHARLLASADATKIEDLDSKNGTRVNGSTICGSILLRNGDQIQVGSVPLTFLVGQGDSTETLS
jgi:DNA-binding winged helix-turn-helix (wHTH) protein